MDIFSKLKKIGRIPIIAQIGGSCLGKTIKSSFGGNFYIKQMEE